MRLLLLQVVVEAHLAVLVVRSAPLVLVVSPAILFLEVAGLLTFWHTDFEIGLPKHERIENDGGSSRTGLVQVLSVMEVKKMNPRGVWGGLDVGK